MTKPIRVAFSGSGFRLPAHVGALCAIRDLNYLPKQYSGTSGGSIVAALAACGMSIDEMKKLALNNNWSKMLTLSLGSLLTGQGYCNGQYMLDWLAEHTGHKTFCDLKTDLIIMSSDINVPKGYDENS